MELKIAMFCKQEAVLPDGAALLHTREVGAAVGRAREALLPPGDGRLGAPPAAAVAADRRALRRIAHDGRLDALLRWYKHFGEARILHGTAHDGLLAAPGLAEYMRAAGTIPAKRTAIEAAFAAGHDVVLWPGGEVDAMRSWRKRDQVVLGGRTGWVRLAIRSGVPIVPVATTGGPETVFVLAEGKRLAKLLGLKALLRTERLPITLGIPFGIAPEILPIHVPLPAKIRTELLEPVYLHAEPERADDRDYVNEVYA
jgi:1-acyl-sn-glycerol-3-phosphate acyltransferase